MEEDIKILKGECDCIYFENGKCEYNNGKSKCDKGKAIENILNRLEQLEKENKELKLKIRDFYRSRGEYIKAKAIMTSELRYDYIPKSVIREKIEELEANKNMNIMARSSQIDILKELLGGSNDGRKVCLLV